MDYDSARRSFQKFWLKQQEDLTVGLRTELKRLMDHPERRTAFAHCLFRHTRGDSRYLINYLMSSRPLTRPNRVNLAEVLRGDYAQKKKRGRPIHREAKDMAGEALFFYRHWRAENKRIGFPDRGYSERMKDDSIAFLLNYFDSKLEAEKVRELMGRPQSRRR